MGVHLVCNRLGDQRLAGAGRAVEQDPLRGLDTEPLEDLRVTERQLDHLPHELEFPSETPDILVMDIGDFLLSLLGLVRFLLELDLGVVCYNGDPFRDHFCNNERDGVPDHINADGLPLNHGPPAEVPGKGTAHPRPGVSAA